MTGIRVRRVLGSFVPLMVTATLAAGFGRRAPHPLGQDRAATPARATAFVYTPGTQRYRLTTVVARTQNQAGGRAPFEFTNTTTMDVTLTLARRTRDTLALTLRVDTVFVASDLDAPPADLTGYRKATLTGLMSPQGHVYAFDAPRDASEPVSNLYRAFRRFLVPFPSGDIGPGTAWSDTTTTTVAVGGFATRTIAITNSRIASDTTYRGQPAWRIDRTGSFTITGNTTTQPDTTRLSGDGTMHATDYVGLSGVFLGNTSTQNTQLQQFKAHEPGVEGTPIQQSIKSTVEEIRS